MWQQDYLVPNIKEEGYPVTKRLYTAVAVLVENDYDLRQISSTAICQAVTTEDLSKNRDLLIKLRTSLHQLKQVKPELAEALQVLNYPTKGEIFYVPDEYLVNRLVKSVPPEPDIITLESNETQVKVPTLEAEMEVITQQQLDLGLVKPKIDIDQTIEFLKGLREMEANRNPQILRTKIERAKTDISLLQTEYNECIQLLAERDLLREAITTKTIIQQGELQHD